MINAYSACAILDTLQHDLEQYKTIMPDLIDWPLKTKNEHIAQINEYIEAVQYCRDLLIYMISQLPTDTVN